ncbi:hypothetical protein BDV29DRAFT_180380 [Aspergillus leporis]|uniref:Uncharacterized protein n=1 Tax=Aspergillus leporis TaxID=41062 RepID=A0A5N5WST1_9EURO|nr:hypothetical protein BDV29DRAFT_180380 [Aspergillus leporis]
MHTVAFFPFYPMSAWCIWLHCFVFLRSLHLSTMESQVFTPSGDGDAHGSRTVPNISISNQELHDVCNVVGRFLTGRRKARHSPARV